jgi:arginine/serine-rich splicing factor 7
MSNRYRIYVGGLSPKTSPRTLKILFARYGHLQEVDLKSAYAFIEFEDYRDAEDALRDMNRRTVDGEVISVEYASRRRDRGDRDMCYNCGKRGHWASECKEVDGRGRCYRCGRKGHERKDCEDRSRSRGKRQDNGGREKSQEMREEYGD